MAARRIDVEEVSPTEYTGRWRRGRRRLSSMKSAQNAGDLEAAQLLAIHAAIAAVDAFTIRRLGLRCVSGRLEDVTRLVAQGGSGPEVVRRLGRILRDKDREPRPDEVEALCDNAEKFVDLVARGLGDERRSP